MKKINKAIFIFILFLILQLSQQITFAQSAKFRSDNPKTVFAKIEEGITFGEVEKFSGSLSSQTYLSLSNGVTGYYSANQAFYILQDFFNIYKPVSFRFISQNEDAEFPYASGYLRYESKGIRSNAQVYIALKQIGANWKITQVTIN